MTEQHEEKRGRDTLAGISVLESDHIGDVYQGKCGDATTQRVTRDRLDWVCSNVRGTNVLDIGCSQGILPVLLARKGFSCVGVDLDEAALRYAQSMRSAEPEDVRNRLTFLQADCSRLPFEDHSFDTCILGEVVEHLESPEACLRETRRVLKTDGVVIITAPFGLLSHPDHKQVFYFSRFVSCISPFFETLRIEQVDKRIRFLGRPAEAGSMSSPFADDQKLLVSTEDMLERVESEKESLRLRALEASQNYRKQCKLVETYGAELRNLREKHRALKWEHDSSHTLFFGKLARLEGGIRLRIGWALRDIRNYGLLRGAGFVTAAFWKLMVRLVTRKYSFWAAGVQSRTLRGYELEFEQNLDKFLDSVKKQKGARFVFIFSGTHEIKEVFGNRPMKQAETLINDGVPVLFSYFRWQRKPVVASVGNPLLFQCPIDLTVRFFDKIMRWDYGEKKKLFIASFPYPYLVRKLNQLHSWGWRTIYDVRDNWEEFAKAGMARWYNSDVERYVVNNTNACCCVSGPLRDKIQKYTISRRVWLNPNAYDTHFLGPDGRDRLAPRSGEKIAGYFGHLTPAWFDWAALNEIAAMLPDWTFEIIGRNSEGHPSLCRNIKLSGPKAHRELNEITKRWRTAIICFKVGLLADGVDPIKIYEYLALGLPTVSFRMPQIHDYPYVFIAGSPQDFAREIVRASEISLERATIGGFIEGNTWEIRVDQMLELVSDEADSCCGLPDLSRDSI